MAVEPPLPSNRQRSNVGGMDDLHATLNGIKATHANGTSSSSKYAIPLNQQLAFTPRKIRVITIGAGYSALVIAHNFQHKNPEMQDIVEHKIFEGRSEVGGTWLVNTYPGVQCDVPAHIYVRLYSIILPEVSTEYLASGLPLRSQSELESFLC